MLLLKLYNESLFFQSYYLFILLFHFFQKFNMEKSSLAGEIMFSHAMRNFRDDINKQSTVTSPQPVDTDKSKVDSKHSTLDFIRKAAQDGIQSSRMTSHLETFLASQESNILMCSNSNNAKEIMAFTTLDVALTMGHDVQISECLADAAMKHLRACKKLENTRYYEFFETIYQLYYEKKGMSILKIICNARIPLSLKEQKECNEYWSDLIQKLAVFETNCKLIDIVKDHHEQKEVDNQMQQISSIYVSGEPYLHRLITHIKLLRSIVPQSEEIEKLGMKSSLLENSIDFYIGYQLFNLGTDLEMLERITNQLQINFVYCILASCCPNLSCCDNNNKNDINNSEIVNIQWGTVILNRYENDSEEFTDVNSQDPNQCVVMILTELVHIMRNSNCTYSMIRGINRKKNVHQINSMKKILEKTQSLINLDLSNLSFGNHTLAFFLNVWNLMMLHAIIKIWLDNPPLNNLQHTISLTTLGYEIGDLGLVTLFTLRKKLLGQTLCTSEILNFENIEELNEPAWQDLDLPQDSRVIFAMINEYYATPIIKIYHPETLNDELYKASNDYLHHYVNHEDQNVLCMPQLVEKYCNCIGNMEDTKIILGKFLNNDKSIYYQPFEYSYDIELEYVKEKSFDTDGISENIQKEDDVIFWMKRTINTNLLQYLEGHCWLFSYLVQRIHETNPTLLDNTCVNIDRTAVLENLINSQWIQNLKSLFDDNSMVTGLWKCVSTNKLWQQFNIHMNKHDFKNCLTIVDALPDSLVTSNVEIQSFRDKILAHLINDRSNIDDDKILQYLYQIKDIKILAQIVLANVKKWPVCICEDALRHVLNHADKNNIPIHSHVHINEILCSVMVYDKILPYYDIRNSNYGTNWYDIVHHTEKTDPICIVKSLIDANQHELCLKWLEYQTASSQVQSLVSQDLFVGLLKNESDDFQHAGKLLQALPIGLSVKLCKSVIGKLESISALRFVIKYLRENCSKEQEKYRQSSLGVEILDQIDSRDRGLYISLIDSPLLMLEQLLMNGKFDTLQRIIINNPENAKFADIPIEEFDELVRFYGNKSLDSRVAVQRDMIDGNKSRDSSLTDSQEFTMPLNTPTKEEWVPNDKARACSCCKVVMFSMFNRRHHCRRCGRVVCASCSSQRMRVCGYADSVLVRVCNDCKRQTVLQAQGTASTPSSETFDCWRLTHDETHNRTLREEFCFEYAPNISLCLAILNLHSDHKAYANFLLDRCDEMKKLLSPDINGRINPEIDHSIIINIIRSLLVAAKVKCAKLGLNTGLADCDRFLSQVDLISTLVQSDCLSLIPRDDLNDHTFRRLRDFLTEKEQWLLALDLSTKSGLDTQGVWAAWGKACLRVGYYEGAREKFAHCLEKVYQEDFDDWVMLSHPGDTSESMESAQDIEKKETKMNETLKNRPSKDPPLLVDILQILEVSNSTDEYSQQITKQTTVTAQEIFNTLNNLKAISHGQYAISKLNCSTRNFRYQESLYYLLMYGSFNSILEFFVRYGEFDKCLSYVLENNIESELFFNTVFLGCLKNGKMENLCTAMKSKDISLLTWKKYLICMCHNLERKQLLHTLYQLQLFMRDYIRAAMTCIRFYVTDASNYVDLCSRNHFLLDAQRHLEAELQVESFGKRQRKSVTSLISSQSSFTMEMEPSEIDRHINTISRQMEIAKFLGACEKEGRSVNEFLSKLSFMDSEGLQPRTVPTLFGNQQERTHLSVLAILCGRDVEEGFGIAFRVMQDYNLRPQKVYSLVGHILALDRKINSIEQLIKCCRSSGAPNSNTISDRVLTHCVKFLLDRLRTESNSGSRDEVDSLIRIINDVELKIGSYIESKQLKAAYLLAVKHSRAQDIRKILKEAERLGQPAIKSICTKWLQQTQQN